MTIAREEGTARSVSRKPRRSDHEVVLVVDDEVQVLQLLKRVLERAGFETHHRSTTAAPRTTRRWSGGRTSSCST